MAKAPAFQFYPKDLLSDTAHLTAEDFGAYWRLCSYAWIGIAGCPQGHLPDDDDMLARLAGTPISPYVRALFAFSEDGLYLIQRRLLAELEKQRDYSKAQSKRGKLGNEARYGRRSAKKAPPKEITAVASATPVRSRTGSPESRSAFASASAFKDLDQEQTAFGSRSSAEPLPNGRPLTPIATMLANLEGRVSTEEAEHLSDMAVFLNGFFPPKRPGAGPDPIVTRWRARIPEDQIIAAIERLRNRVYRWGDGPEMTWGQLEEDICRKVIIAELNGLIRAGV